VQSSLDPELIAELERRSARLAAFFDLSALEGHGATTEEIKRYYEESRIGYRYVHSKAGAMHMALNPDGTFDRAGYEGQAGLVQARLTDADHDILELACGNGFNLELLAARNPQRSFVGIDLVESQIRRAGAALASHPNASVHVGDFQALDFPADSFDCVFVVESFCHATDLPLAFQEVRRVLRPGGRFVVIDGWRTALYGDAPDVVRAMAANVELAMAVSAAVPADQWDAAAVEHGFAIVEELDLSSAIKPNLERLARGADRLLAHPRLAALARMFLPRSLVQNAVAGYLMPVTVELGVHTYRRITLQAG
jgi:SAM-dependent methyltransferase